MNRLLAIETSGEACSVALFLDGETRERHELAPMRHAELLLPAVRSLLAEADIPLGRLEAIAFGRGPGSFTSLRIGIGVVQGLAWGADLPVVPLSSLATVAQQVLVVMPASSLPGTEILVAVDARMNEVFHAAFSASAEGIVMARGEEGVCGPGKFAPARRESTIGAGNGFARYPALLDAAKEFRAVLPELAPRATALFPLAQHWLRTNKALPAESAQPVYVRDQVAEKSR